MNKFKKDKLIKYFFFTGWFLLWGTLSFNPEIFQNIKNNNFSETDYKQIINLLRGASTFVFGIILISILFFNIIKINFLEKDFFLFCLFILLFFLQSIPYFIYNLPNYNLYFLFNSILCLISLICFIKYLSKDELKIIVYINNIFLIFICIYFGSKYLNNFFFTHNPFYSLWGNLKTDILNLETPRPTGLSRSFLLVYIFFTFFNFNKINFFNFDKIIQTVCVTFVILLSSRTSIFLLFIIFVLEIFWLNKSKINLFTSLIYKIIIPFIIIVLIISYKNFLIETGKIKQINESIENSNFFSSNLRIYKPYNPNRPKTDFSSGRYDDWKKIIENNENIFFGNGVMGDRILISQSASNAILYTYASSGLIGALLFIFLSSILFILVLKIIYANDQKNNDLKIISALSIIIIMLRSILETSYAVFGIDFLILSSSLAILIKFKNN